MGKDNKLLDQVFRYMLQADARGESYLIVARQRFPFLSKHQFDLAASLMSLFKDGYIDASMDPDGVLRFRAVVRDMLN